MRKWVSEWVSKWEKEKERKKEKKRKRKRKREREREKEKKRKKIKKGGSRRENNKRKLQAESFDKDVWVPLPQWLIDWRRWFEYRKQNDEAYF